MIDILLSMDLAGGSVVLLWLLAQQLGKGRLPAKWHYGILKSGLVFFMLPVQRCFAWVSTLTLLTEAVAHDSLASKPSAVPLPNIPAAVSSPAVQVFPSIHAPETALAPDMVQVLTVLWIIGAVAALLWRLWSFARFRRLVLRRNRPFSGTEASEVLDECRRQLCLRRRVAIQVNPLVRTPLVAGIFRPVIILPTEFLSCEDLRYIFLHELTHIKYGDLLIRQLSMLASILHWYDPLVHLLHKHIQLTSEQSCDARVSSTLSRQERYAYGSLLLKLAAYMAGGSGEWAIPLSAKETLERRLYHMLHPDTLKGWKRIVSVVFAVAILTCGTVAAFAISIQSSADGTEGPVDQWNLSSSDITVPDPVSPVEPDIAPPQAPTEETPNLSETLELLMTPAPVSAVEPDVAPEQIFPEGTQNLPETLDVPAVPKASGAPPMPEAPVIPEETHTPPASQDFTVPEDHIFSFDDPVEIWAAYALRGDTDLILCRGGTLLPDDKRSSYTIQDNVPVKLFYSKETTPSHWLALPEYTVGNMEALALDCLQAASSLPDGVYPVNSKGDSYGLDCLSDYVGYPPDLVKAIGVNGEDGYIDEADLSLLPRLPAGQCPHDFTIPLYDQERNVIGEFPASCGGHFQEMFPGATLDEAKEYLRNGYSE